LVVISFLTETVIAQLVASRIDQAVALIVTNTSPSVITLATARAELHRIQDFVSDYVDGGGRRVDRERLDGAQAELARAEAAYLRLPFTPGEREVWERVAGDTVILREIIARTLTAVEKGDLPRARALVRQDLRTAVDTASADIASDIRLNANVADTQGRLIARSRRRSLQAAIGLGIASVALTALVAVLVYRLGARHDALQRQHATVLEAANAELEIFASRLAHDIISPLASTRLAIDAALKAEANDRIRRSLHRGASALDRVSRIAQALFEFARAAARPSPTERGDVNAVVNDVLDEYRPLADTTGTALGSSLATHDWVACNEGLLTVALSNLVRNAITHVDGGPAKRVDVLVVDAHDRVRIEVRDNGPGLTPGTEASVFEPFVRGPEATRAGLGLGLATVKRIVETHGGAVGVTSRSGVGARFWMELPKANGVAPA
jgi:signal transduction histidine kinase